MNDHLFQLFFGLLIFLFMFLNDLNKCFVQLENIRSGIRIYIKFNDLTRPVLLETMADLRLSSFMLLNYSWLNKLLRIET